MKGQPHNYASSGPRASAGPPSRSSKRRLETDGFEADVSREMLGESEWIETEFKPLVSINNINNHN